MWRSLWAFLRFAWQVFRLALVSERGAVVWMWLGSEPGSPPVAPTPSVYGLVWESGSTVVFAHERMVLFTSAVDAPRPGGARFPIGFKLLVP